MNTLFYNYLLLSNSLIRAEGEELSMWPSIWMMLIIIFIFYFVLIAPQRKEAKERDDMRNKLVKGDEVVTIGGVHAQVVSVDKDTVTLRLGGKVEVDFDKSAVSRLKKK